MEVMIRKIRIHNHLRFEARMTQINRAFFFTHVRRMMFSNNLDQSEVDGMNAILDGWEAKYAADDDRWLAYALATTYHEPISTCSRSRNTARGAECPTASRIPDRTGLLWAGIRTTDLGAQLQDHDRSAGRRLRQSSRPGARTRQCDEHHVHRHDKRFVHWQIARRLFQSDHRGLGERAQNH